MKRAALAAVAAITLLVALAGSTPAAPKAKAAAGKASGHGSITAGLDCSACHTPEGWKLAAGATGGSGFDHAKTGFPLLGAHASTACTACHTGTGAGAGKLPMACAGCHQDDHAGKLGNACAECHTAVEWKDTHTLARHQRTRLPLTGKHATIECNACHVVGDRKFSDTPSQCFACHEQDYRHVAHPDHDGDPSNATLVPFSRECGQCHRTTGWRPATVDPAKLPGRRLARAAVPEGHDSRFAISYGKHKQAPCESCHLDGDGAGGDRRLVACNGCHTAERVRAQHKDRVDVRAAAACLRCHPGGSAR